MPYWELMLHDVSFVLIAPVFPDISARLGPSTRILIRSTPGGRRLRRWQQGPHRPPPRLPIPGRARRRDVAVRNDADCLEHGQHNGERAGPITSSSPSSSTSTLRLASGSGEPADVHPGLAPQASSSRGSRSTRTSRRVSRAARGYAASRVQLTLRA
ncbi:hypothetical protein K438DRAFT_1961885 [Mycena galopus ATCC 62051]|nr:hypothetical protein K438DRAFT_1961885 [Mycena galopus ATCC 62051]